LVCCALLIFTTFSAHDFPDVGGDKTSGRRTFPIVAPSASRWFVSAMVILWTMSICYSWSLDFISRSLFFGLGVVIGVRFLLFRDDSVKDRRTLTLYKVLSSRFPCARHRVISDYFIDLAHNSTPAACRPESGHLELEVPHIETRRVVFINIFRLQSFGEFSITYEAHLNSRTFTYSKGDS